MLASSSSRYCQDWRSPGLTWTRTPLGWRMGRDAIENRHQRHETREGGGAVAAAPTSDPGANFKELRNKCVQAGKFATTREVHDYKTLSDALDIMNFECALRNDKYYYFISRVLLVAYDRLFGAAVSISSSQIKILKLTHAACQIAVSSKDTSKATTMSVVVEKGLQVLEKILEGPSAERSQYRERYNTLKVWKVDLDSHIDCTAGNISLLKDDCLRCIVSYLSHPCDILHLGLTNRKLHTITEESWVWSQLAQRLLKRDLTVMTSDNSGLIDMKETFKQLYMNMEISVDRHPYTDAARRCCDCNMVFWKDYGHECIAQFIPNSLGCVVLAPATFLDQFGV